MTATTQTTSVSWLQMSLWNCCRFGCFPPTSVGDTQRSYNINKMAKIHHRKPCNTSSSVAVTCCLLVLSCSTFSSLAAPQQNPSLQRSNSDTRFNRNGTTANAFQRQSSFKENSCSLNYNFDYLQLSLSWPPGSCSTSPQECKKGSNKQFNIHGLWPTIKGTQEPSNCCHEGRFDFRALQPLLADLDEHWYSYYDPNSNRGFGRTSGASTAPVRETYPA